MNMFGLKWVSIFYVDQFLVFNYNQNIEDF